MELLALTFCFASPQVFVDLVFIQNGHPALDDMLGSSFGIRSHVLRQLSPPLSISVRAELPSKLVEVLHLDIRDLMDANERRPGILET